MAGYSGREWGVVDGEALDLRRRILVVDDDPSLRLLVRATLPVDEFAVEETSSAEEAAELARWWRPSLVVLDVGLPAISGLAFCRELKDSSRFGRPSVLLLTGAETSSQEARAAGADALLRKPFSPLELVSLIDRLPSQPIPTNEGGDAADSEQLLVYARDLSRLLQQERKQRRRLEQAYRQTVTVLVDALEAKDPQTSSHALRVHHYALALDDAADDSLLDDPSLEYGFLLHDIGKLAIPDQILNKPGPLSNQEMRLVRQHPTVGAQLLREVALLQGEGIRVVRSHHERWDGNGYPDRLAGTTIPAGARAFAVADTLDAMTHDRPYRKRIPWDDALADIEQRAGSKFDPSVVDALVACEPDLRSAHASTFVTAA